MPFTMEEEDYLLDTDGDKILTSMFHKEKTYFTKGDTNSNIIKLKELVTARYDKQIEAVKLGEPRAAERCYRRGDIQILMARRDNLLASINRRKIDFLLGNGSWEASRVTSAEFRARFIRTLF